MGLASARAGALTEPSIREGSGPVADGRGGRWGGEPLGPIIALAIVVALIGLLLLPLLHVENAGGVNGVNVLATSKSDLCFNCSQDAPYHVLLWLEVIVALCGLLVGLGLCLHGEGRVVVGRTVLLVAAGLILLWAPLQTDASERPIAVVLVFAALGIGTLVLAAVTVRRSLPRWGVIRAVVLAVASIALAIVPKTRSQMPFPYDRVLWGYLVAFIAAWVSTIVAIAAAGSLGTGPS